MEDRYTKDQYTFEEFKEIIERLRAEDGCPWDREQTHESLMQCMTEEAAELLAAIRIYKKTGDPENMKEELGDVLLQVLMHSQIAEEEGLFSAEDVITEVSRKMIRRHPHVFGAGTAEDTGAVLRNWEEIKKKEKEGKDWVPSQLRQIPEELPALIRAEKVWKKVDKLYEKQPGPEALLDRLKSFTGKLEQALKEGNEKAESIYGEILSTLASMAGKLGFQPEIILNEKVEEIIQKYENEA